MSFSIAAIGLKIAEFAFEKGVPLFLSKSAAPKPIVRILDSTFNPEQWGGRCIYIENPFEEEIVIRGIIASRPDVQIARDISDNIQWHDNLNGMDFVRVVRIPPKMAREFPVAVNHDVVIPPEEKHWYDSLIMTDEPDDCFFLIRWRTHKKKKRPIRYECKIGDLEDFDDPEQDVIQPRK